MDDKEIEFEQDEEKDNGNVLAWFDKRKWNEPVFWFCSRKSSDWLGWCDELEEDLWWCVRSLEMTASHDWHWAHTTECQSIKSFEISCPDVRH